MAARRGQHRLAGRRPGEILHTSTGNDACFKFECISTRCRPDSCCFCTVPPPCRRGVCLWCVFCPFFTPFLICTILLVQQGGIYGGIPCVLYLSSTVSSNEAKFLSFEHWWNQCLLLPWNLLSARYSKKCVKILWYCDKLSFCTTHWGLG